jgi:hypothetical protein
MIVSYEVVRPKSVAEWRQIVDSHYAARDADGFVRSPNWAVLAARCDDDGEWGGEVVDVVPALPEEIPAPRGGSLRVLEELGPADREALAVRIGYPADSYEFELDLTGCYTAAFIRSHKVPQHPYAHQSCRSSKPGGPVLPRHDHQSHGKGFH